MKFGPSDTEDFSAQGSGVFIICEGNYMYGNASLSYYSPTDGVQNEVFVRSNAIRLGDVAQSMSIYGDTGFIAVNNSGVVFAIDLNTFRIKRMLTGVNSPRHTLVLSDTKAYLTDLYDSRITIFDPHTMQISGYIPTPSHRSTEQLVRLSDKVYTNCWSYDNTILCIDTSDDTVCDSLKIDGQPAAMQSDVYGNLWVVTDTGATGTAAPKLYRIKTSPLSIDRTWTLPYKAAVDIATSGNGSRIYVLNKHIYQLSYNTDALPDEPLIDCSGRKIYAIGADPVSGEIYSADAIDYVQPASICRYDKSGKLLDTFKVGITPGDFCFKQ